MERKKRNPMTSFNSLQFEVTKKSAMIFKGRLLLKTFYLEHALLDQQEINSESDIQDESLFYLIAEFKERGLDAAADYLKFSTAGIILTNQEGGYGHLSREKLAIFYFIISFELGKPLLINPLIKSELLFIKTLSNLVTWITSLKQNKDIQSILERKALIALQPLQAPPMPSIPNEALMTTSELADALKISERTIRRNPTVFKPHFLGARKYYYLSECKPQYHSKK
jgi:hypothetical protein